MQAAFSLASLHQSIPLHVLAKSLADTATPLVDADRRFLTRLLCRHAAVTSLLRLPARPLSVARKTPSLVLNVLRAVLSLGFARGCGVRSAGAAVTLGTSVVETCAAPIETLAALYAWCLAGIAPRHALRVAARVLAFDMGADAIGYFMGSLLSDDAYPFDPARFEGDLRQALRDTPEKFYTKRTPSGTFMGNVRIWSDEREATLLASAAGDHKDALGITLEAMQRINAETGKKV